MKAMHAPRTEPCDVRVQAKIKELDSLLKKRAKAESDAKAKRPVSSVADGIPLPRARPR